MKKRRLVKALLFLAFVTLAVSLACNGGAKETPVVATPTPAPAEEVATPTPVPPEEVATPTPPPKEEVPTPTPVPNTPTPAPVGTSPSNPIPLGSPFTAANGAKITINGITVRGPEAASLVKEWNTFNDEPGEGKEYVIISGNVAYEGGKEETLTISSFLDFRAVVKGVITDTADLCCQDEMLSGEMFAGGSIDGYLVFEVDEGTTGIVVIYTVLLEESYYFATE